MVGLQENHNAETVLKGDDFRVELPICIYSVLLWLLLDKEKKRWYAD